MYCLSHENKGADELRSYCQADLRLCFRIGKIRFSQDSAHMKVPYNEVELKLFKGLSPECTKVFLQYVAQRQMHVFSSMCN